MESKENMLWEIASIEKTSLLLIKKRSLNVHYFGKGTDKSFDRKKLFLFLCFSQA